MNTRTSHISLELASVPYCITQYRVVRVLCLLQFGNGIYGVGKVDFQLLILILRVGDTVRNKFAQMVRVGKRQLLHSRNIFQCHLGSHCTVGDDVRHLLLAIFLGYPIENATTTFIIEIDIDIGQ